MVQTGQGPGLAEAGARASRSEGSTTNPLRHSTGMRISGLEHDAERRADAQEERPGRS